jgi:hypothetical protein
MGGIFYQFDKINLVPYCILNKIFLGAQDYKQFQQRTKKYLLKRKLQILIEPA